MLITIKTNNLNGKEMVKNIFLSKQTLNVGLTKLFTDFSQPWSLNIPMTHQGCICYEQAEVREGRKEYLWKTNPICLMTTKINVRP